MKKFDDRKLDDHVPVEKMFLPTEYGRGLDRSHVKKIIARFDERALGRIVVSMREDGTFAIIDGNHRIEALRSMGIKEAPCTIFIDLSSEEESELFSSLNATKNLTALDKMKARIAAREHGAVEMRSVLKRYGLDWAFSAHHSSFGYVSCAAAIEDVYIWHGMTVLADVIRILVQAFGATAHRAFISSTIRGTAMFWIRYRSELKEVRLFEQLHQTDATSLMIEAKKLAAAFRETTDVAWGKAMRDLYNRGLRANGPSVLSEWREFVISEKARATASERVAKGNAIRRERGEDVAASLRTGRDAKRQAQRAAQEAS